MKSINDLEIKEILEAVHYRPCVSIIFPLDTKINMRTETMHTLKLHIDQVEKELKENYTVDVYTVVIQKLKNLMPDINFNTNKKSIAIYVSPVFEKVIYLDKKVDPKIIIDESFEIRDLVFNSKELKKYLILMISLKECKMYMANSENFVRIKSNLPESVFAYKNDIPERVFNFSDPDDRQQILLNKYLNHIEIALDQILNTYHLPLFIMGAEKTLGFFKKITKHNAEIIDSIHGNFDEYTVFELKAVLDSYVTQWKKSLQNNILEKLDLAADHQKLAVGIKEVWREAMNCKGKLLVIEKNYLVKGIHQDMSHITIEEPTGSVKTMIIEDAVDDIIEVVLENGGDVEFVAPNAIEKYQHIALELYY